MRKLFVGNLPFSVTDEQLKAHFNDVANVVKATIVTDKETGRPRGFGFVELATDKGAQDCVDHLNGSDMMGRQLNVQLSQERPRTSGGNGRQQGYDNRGGNRW